MYYILFVMFTSSFQPRATSNVPPAAASRLFRDFTPSGEGPQPVRQLLVTGDPLQFLRDKRDMLRAMTPDQAYHAIDWRTGLRFVEAMAIARETGRLIVPHDVVDDILMKTDYQVPQIHSGTVVIYGAPGKPFTNEVVFGLVRFSVPEQFRGKTNCALVVECPDFELVERGIWHELVVPDERNLHLVESFPKQGHWYQPDRRFRIPLGDVTYSNGSKCLWLTDGSSYVGCVSRGFDGPGDYGRSNVTINLGLSYGLSVALF